MTRVRICELILGNLADFTKYNSLKKSTHTVILIIIHSIRMIKKN